MISISSFYGQKENVAVVKPFKNIHGTKDTTLLDLIPILEGFHFSLFFKKQRFLLMMLMMFVII